MKVTGRRPDLVESLLVIGNDPALGDPGFSDAKDPDRSPGEGLTALLDLASGEDHGALIVREHATYVDPERRVGQLASPGKITQHLIPALIIACDCTGTRHVPGHIFGEHRAYRLLIVPGVEAILAIMEIADELRIRMGIGYPVTVPLAQVANSVR